MPKVVARHILRRRVCVVGFRPVALDGLLRSPQLHAALANQSLQDIGQGIFIGRVRLTAPGLEPQIA